MIRNYLEWMIELPWSKSHRRQPGPGPARQILDEDHYDLEKVKKRILEYLAVRKLKPDMKVPSTALWGARHRQDLPGPLHRPGPGPQVRASLPRGRARRGPIFAATGAPIGRLAGPHHPEHAPAGSNNPVFIQDEVDKIGADFRGDPSSALLEVLDPEQNNSFTDHYLDVGFATSPR